MFFKIFFSLLSFLLLFQCSEKITKPTIQQTDTITNLEYTVLQTTVDSLFGFLNDRKIILLDSTSSGIPSKPDSILTIFLDLVKQKVFALDPETIQDFKSKNLKKTYIQKPLSIYSNCTFSSDTTARYPFMQVSRVGFNSGPLSGSGVYYVLAEEQNKCKILVVNCFGLANKLALHRVLADTRRRNDFEME